ncbi:MAG TPA: hypothetical protein PK175_03035 [Syntrophales bacterium]|jgi:hypothetical protein|nr:hypothetical protein [Syntrophales bacterium]HOU76540.1 hypothetical protein [Syntrophales bacterium]HQG33830.1 hypothetical protein [Syntrophales bacterium]HQI35128.1 hypothetical protein [Syntrophales bacterium]HQJ30956.1 hypothetical protein [Syntrophales bacterium]
MTVSIMKHDENGQYLQEDKIASMSEMSASGRSFSSIVVAACGHGGQVAGAGGDSTAALAKQGDLDDRTLPTAMPPDTCCRTAVFVPAPARLRKSAG